MKKLILCIFFILIGCSEPEPTNIKLLKNTDGIYYNSQDKPFTGEVFRTYSDNSEDIWISGTLKLGYPETYIEPVNFEKLNFRNDIFFVINSSTPYSGPFYLIINDNVIEEGNLLNGKINGKIVGYFPSGQVKYEGFSKDGKIDFTNNFYENGQFESKIQYSNNEPTSESFYFDNGQLKEKKSYKDDKLDGKYVSYFEDGQIKKDIVYQNGNMKSHTYYFSNGKVEREGTGDCEYRIYGYEIDGSKNTDLKYENCKEMDGFISLKFGSKIYENRYKRYYENGKQVREDYELYNTDLDFIETKGTSINEKKEGQWTEYFNKEDIKKRENYKNGKLEGKSVTYWRYGNPRFVKHYKQGEENGIFQEFDVTGNLILEREYKDGMKNGIYNTYYSNGQIRLQSNYKNDLQVGSEKSFYSNGKLEYEFESSTGTHSYYFKNGDLQERYIEINGSKEGPFIEYDMLGQISKEGNYKNDLPDGVITHYLNGDKYMILEYKNGLLINSEYIGRFER